VTAALFLADFQTPRIGGQVSVAGDEGRHAGSVRRIRVGEEVLVADGKGTAIRGTAREVGKSQMAVQIVEILHTAEHPVRYTAVQALPKGDRAELAVEVLTEAGVGEIIPWQAERSIVKWTGERAERGLVRWRAAAREAAKQSRRFRVPAVSPALSTAELLARVRGADLALALHETAAEPLARLELPSAGEILFIIGPEGGLSDAELAAFADAGAQVVLLGDGVLRTSTAGVVALAQLQALGAAGEHRV
jgi:16S rRNA (uracil1498-N3)-methyltransferase